MAFYQNQSHVTGEASRTLNTPFSKSFGFFVVFETLDALLHRNPVVRQAFDAVHWHTFFIKMPGVSDTTKRLTVLSAEDRMTCQCAAGLK